MAAMLPPLRFARTEDGVDIAYFSLGRGPAVVFASNVWGDANMYGAPHPHTRYMTDRLVALGWRVIRYDVRGMGASQREVDDLSMEARALDLAAVIEHAQVPRCAVAGVDGAGVVALLYAARNPERVSRVVTLNAWADGRRRYGLSPASRALAALLALAEDDWPFFCLSLAKLVTELDDPGHTRNLATLFERSSTPRMHCAMELASSGLDATPYLGCVEVPVLAVHDSGFPFGSLNLVRDLVARLPKATLGLVEADRDAEIELIDSFLREGEAPADGRPRGRSEPAVRTLTPREAEVLRLIAMGHTNQEIAATLVLSMRTVARHITNIYGKIGARSKADATAFALRNGLV